MNKVQRDEALSKISENAATKVILISFKAGSTGLNLTCCNNVILVDPWWNPALEDQAFDRAHRFGQKRTVNIYKLCVPDTVEQRILEVSIAHTFALMLQVLTCRRVCSCRRRSGRSRPQRCPVTSTRTCVSASMTSLPFSAPTGTTMTRTKHGVCNSSTVFTAARGEAKVFGCILAFLLCLAHLDCQYHVYHLVMFDTVNLHALILLSSTMSFRWFLLLIHKCSWR